LRKAYRYDDEIIFYFDAFDNKYVAQGGSLAWRLNNPGLLLSHVCTEQAISQSARIIIMQYSLIPS
jgi:hypothetical protein